MRQKRNISLLAASLLLASSALAQVRSWQNVQALQPGTPIAVKSAQKIRCNFVAATDEELVCEGASPGQFMFPDSQQFRFQRASIRQVRTVRRDMRRPGMGDLIGAGIGAGIGVAIGSRCNSKCGNMTAVLGVLGAALGAGMGHAMTQGQIIYGR
jgi:hypothetical protein